MDFVAVVDEVITLLRQRVSRRVGEAWSCITTLTHALGAMPRCIGHDHLRRAVAETTMPCTTLV